MYNPVAFIIEGEEYCYNCGKVIINKLGPTEEEVISLTEFEEVDSPRHCANCEALLDFNLTSDGVEYVLERLKDYVRIGHGRVEILKQWADEVSLYVGLDKEQEEIIKRFYESIGEKEAE